MSAIIKETLGDKYNKVLADSTRYDPVDMAFAMVEKIPLELITCAERHKKIFDEDEYFIGFVISDDPMLKGIRRQKFHALMFMPTPVPEQAIWLYNKITDEYKFMWCLPDPYAMANYSTLTYVDEEKRRIKTWCDAYFNGNFWETIRSMHGIEHLSEHEYRLKHRNIIPNFKLNEGNPCLTETFDFSKVSFGDVYHTGEIVSLENANNDGRQAEAVD